VPEVIVRACRDLDDLVAIYEAIGRQFGEIWSEHDRRLEEPRSRFGTDRELMLAVEVGDVVRGGVIAFGDDAVTVRAIGLDQDLRGRGVGRLLLELIEARALVRGARVVTLGAADDARGFYERLGYRGKHAMREKQLPLPGAVRPSRRSRDRRAEPP
jgi:GNAT superfamily N-acetyltransferase